MWIAILTITPSVEYESGLFIDNFFSVRVDYDYDVYVPPTYVNKRGERGETCRIEYQLLWTDEKLDIYLKENNLPNEFKYFDPTKALENRECGLHA